MVAKYGGEERIGGELFGGRWKEWVSCLVEGVAA